MLSFFYPFVRQAQATMILDIMYVQKKQQKIEGKWTMNEFFHFLLPSWPNFIIILFQKNGEWGEWGYDGYNNRLEKESPFV